MTYLLPHTIINSANRFPDREAFKYGQNVLTFSQMAVRINQLAALLHQIGIKKGDRIGIYLNRSLETAIAIYGIMHAGAVYVPLDPKAPVHRTCFLLKDCGIDILITNPTQKRTLRKIVEGGQQLKAIIGLKQDWKTLTIAWEEVQSQPTTFSCPFPVLEKDLAYIMYTSGSTGHPKGIMHTHSSGLSFAKLAADLYQITEQDRLINHAPIYFDISTLGYFAAPLSAACTVIASDAHTILPTSLSQLIETERLTIWYSVPLALVQMIEKGMLEQRDASSLRWVLYGGEPFPPKHLPALMRTCFNAQISNVYGPAEVNQCTYFNFSSPPPSDQAIPLGQVWKNTEMIVLDDQDQEITTAGSGELLIRSATMMQGYWQQPKLTEKGFYRKKTAAGVETIFYKTGDLVELDEAGVLHFLGRKDHQVKIRGYRVELSSVESGLTAHPMVSEAAAFSARTQEEVLQIEAAVILNTQDGVTAKDLLVFLKDKLPLYAIPASVKIVDSFPRTGSGKVKRSALKKQLNNDKKITTE